MLYIMWTNGRNLIKFCKCIEIDKIVGKDKLFFVIFQLSYGPLLMSLYCAILMNFVSI